MTAHAKGPGKWLVRVAAAVLALVVLVAAVALINSRTTDGPVHDEQTLEELAEAHEAADFYINSDQLPEARVILERLVHRFPDDGQSHALKAKLLMAENDFTEAYRYIQRSVELEPDDHEVQFLAGLLAEINGEFEAARPHYARATELAPQAAGYAMYLAQSLIRLEEIDEAETHLDRAQRLDATLSQTYSMQAEVAARRGDVEAAIEQVNKALDRVKRGERHYVSYTIQKAELLLRDDNADAARTVLLELPPAEQQEQRVVEQLAKAYLALDQPERAAAVWAELFALEPANARAAAEAGMAFIQAQQYDHARQYHQLARRVTNDEDETLLALEEALQGAN